MSFQIYSEQLNIREIVHCLQNVNYFVAVSFKAANGSIWKTFKYYEGWSLSSQNNVMQPNEYGSWVIAYF